MSRFTIHQGNVFDVLPKLEEKSIQTCVTSPPYWGLRNYSVEGQLGQESTPEVYVENMVKVFSEVKRILRDDGTLWLNLGSTYMSGGGASRHRGYTDPKYSNGRDGSFDEPSAFSHPLFKPKDLVPIPFMVAMALQEDGWYLRSDIIWKKPNAMPSSVRDRPATSHEYIFLLSKSPRYYYDNEAVKEPVAAATIGRVKRAVSATHKHINGADGQTRHTMNQPRPYDPEREVPLLRNCRSVWTVPTKAYKGAHFATFPEDLITPCVLAGAAEDGVVLDPFAGSGTTGIVSLRHGRSFVGVELNPVYIELANERLCKSRLLLKAAA